MTPYDPTQVRSFLRNTSLPAEQGAVASRGETQSQLTDKATHWYSEYQVGEMTDNLLRATAASVFASAPGRTYWRNAGTFWRDNYSGRRARRFHRVLEDAYQQAIKKPPSTPPVSESLPVPEVPRADRWRVTVLAAAGGGVAAALVVRAIRRALRGH